jgi:hypothetical protein
MDKNKCDICGKCYKNRSGLWKHKQNHKKQNEKFYKCEICGKVYKHKQSKYNHQKTCEKKEKETGITTINKNTTVNDNSTTTNITNNINNTTNNINNTANIMIINFGEGKPLDFLTERDKLNILKQYGGGAIEYCIKIVHFNDKLPQFRNIETKNLKDKYCSIYKDGEFITALKNECYEEMISNRVIDIDDINQEYQETISNRIYESINRMCDKIPDDEKYMKTKMENVRLISHNDYTKKKKRLSIRHQKQMIENQTKEDKK